MGFAFRLMIWVIAFNLAVGIVAYSLGYDVTNKTYTYNQGGQLQGDTSTRGTDQAEELWILYNQSAGVPVEEVSFWYRFLDVISLGFYNKIMAFLNKTVYALPMLLANSSLITPVLLPYIKAIITLIFIMGTFELFTGKDLTQR